MEFFFRSFFFFFFFCCGFLIPTNLKTPISFSIFAAFVMSQTQSSLKERGERKKRKLGGVDVECRNSVGAYRQPHCLDPDYSCGLDEVYIWGGGGLNIDSIYNLMITFMVGCRKLKRGVRY